MRKVIVLILLFCGVIFLDVACVNNKPSITITKANWNRLIIERAR